MTDAISSAAELPPLPKPCQKGWIFDSSQMRAYALEAIDAWNRRALLSASKPAAPAQSGEPVAWLVEWKEQFSDETWVHAHANELTARDQARANGGTCTPLYAVPQPPQSAEGGETALPAWFDAFLTNVCEIPDRNSPDDEPEAIVATLEELKACALNAIENAGPSTGVCFFCGAPINGPHETDCPQANPSAVVLDDERAPGKTPIYAREVIENVAALRFLLRGMLDEGHQFDSADALMNVIEENIEEAMSDAYAQGEQEGKDRARAVSPQPVAQPVEQTRALTDDARAVQTAQSSSMDLCVGSCPHDDPVADRALSHYWKLRGESAPQPVEQTRALTGEEIEKGWHKTFSTNNPYCPCDLKSFTKAVRWAEWALTGARTASEGDRE